MIRRTLTTFFVVAILCNCALGQEKTWPKGTRTFDLSTRYTFNMGPTEVHIPSVAFSAHQFVFDNFSLGAELSGYAIFQDGDDAWGGGLAAILRHHLLDFGGTTMFVDASFGPMQASHRVHEDGTHFNFTTRCGLGVMHRLDNDCHLIGGARWFHLSNARMHGDDRNPSVNGIEWYLGMGWEW